MIHHRQGLALGFETCHDLLGVHPRFDDFQCDLAFDRSFLLGDIDRTHPAFADQLA